MEDMGLIMPVQIKDLMHPSMEEVGDEEHLRLVLMPIVNEEPDIKESLLFLITTILPHQRSTQPPLAQLIQQMEASPLPSLLAIVEDYTPKPIASIMEARGKQQTPNPSQQIKP
jgi:hypothetical protein